MTRMVLDRRSSRGGRTHWQETRQSRKTPAQSRVLRRNTAALPPPSNTITEDDLNYYYDQVERFWLTGLSTNFAQIRDHLPATEHARLPEGLATLIGRNWLKLQEIPVTDHDDRADHETCYVPVKKVRPYPTAENHAAR